MNIYPLNYAVLFLYITSAVLGFAFLVTYLYASRNSRRISLVVVDAIGWVATIAFGNAFLLRLLWPRLSGPIGPTQAYVYTFLIQTSLLILITIRWIRWTQIRREVRENGNRDMLRAEADQ